MHKTAVVNHGQLIIGSFYNSHYLAGDGKINGLHNSIAFLDIIHHPAFI
jgi:hypothetical protein